jgi:hypothetical protein
MSKSALITFLILKSITIYAMSHEEEIRDCAQKLKTLSESISSLTKEFNDDRYAEQESQKKLWTAIKSIEKDMKGLSSRYQTINVQITRLLIELELCLYRDIGEELLIRNKFVMIDDSESCRYLQGKSNEAQGLVRAMKALIEFENLTEASTRSLNGSFDHKTKSKL